MIVAAYIGRRLGAVLPLTIVAAAILLVGVSAVLVPTRGRREVAVDILRELTKFGAVLLGPPLGGMGTGTDESRGF